MIAAAFIFHPFNAPLRVTALGPRRGRKPRRNAAPFGYAVFGRRSRSSSRLSGKGRICQDTKTRGRPERRRPSPQAPPQASLSAAALHGRLRRPGPVKAQRRPERRAGPSDAACSITAQTALSVQANTPGSLGHRHEHQLPLPVPPPCSTPASSPCSTTLFHTSFLSLFPAAMDT